jgi:hypothetical protein
MFEHSFSRACEVAAKDANKVCVYDSECEKKSCIYPIPESCIDKIECNYPQSSSAVGKCDTFVNDSDGALQCHRLSPKPGIDSKGEKGKVYCSFTIS